MYSTPILKNISLALIVAGMTACIESKSTDCGDGFMCPAGTKCAAGKNQCIVGDCGDSFTQTSTGEECDDGNIDSDDGCSSTCKIERCGDQFTSALRNEVCDDGNTNSGDGCSSDCQSKEECGNGIRDVGEECDDGNNSDNDDCLTTCLLARCGDGFTHLHGTGREACDDGPHLDGPCRSDCRSLKKCGNALVDPGEECDDGNDIDTDACPRTCKNAFCGDGFVLDSKGHREECDDGNTSACGSCNATCTQKQEPARAQGSIQVDLADGGSIQDGEILIVGDGVRRCIFEFDRDDKIIDTHIGLKTATPDSGANVVEAIHVALLYARDNVIDPDCRASDAGSFASHPGLRMNCQLEDGGTRLNLTHLDLGPQGNQPIIESVENPGFTVTSLSGGTGMDCPAGTGCTDDRDCDPVDGRHECLKDDDQPVGRCGRRGAP